VTAVSMDDVTVFSACPPAGQENGSEYLRRVRQVAEWSDRAGCSGILIYADNRTTDPWLVSQIILQNTANLSPLIAVQPVYMHPFSAAKMVADLTYFYGRRIHLNIVAGGFKGDLLALGDTLEHDARYDRASEYALIMKRLLTSRGPDTFEGEYFSVSGKLDSIPPTELAPRFLLSGSSAAGLAAARAVGATAVSYPASPNQQASASDGIPHGLRIGIISRDTAQEAWKTAHARFPEDRAGQISHRLAMGSSDSQWHEHLSGATDRSGAYWMRPFKNYKTFCPYLVGDHATVGNEIKKYLTLGYKTLILDAPVEEKDLAHTNAALAVALNSLKSGAHE